MGGGRRGSQSGQTSIQGQSGLTVHLNFDIPADADDEQIRDVARRIRLLLDQADIEPSDVQYKINALLQESGLASDEQASIRLSRDDDDYEGD